MILWAIFRASRGLQLVALLLACWGIWQTNNAYQRSRGASELAATIEAKSDATARTADEVRQDVSARKRGRPDPFRVRD